MPKVDGGAGATRRTCWLDRSFSILGDYVGGDVMLVGERERERVERAVKEWRYSNSLVCVISLGY